MQVGPEGPCGPLSQLAEVGERRLAARIVLAERMPRRVPTSASVEAHVEMRSRDGRSRLTRSFTLRARCSECVRGRLPLPEALRDEMGPLLFAPTVQHLEI